METPASALKRKYEDLIDRTGTKQKAFGVFDSRAYIAMSKATFSDAKQGDERQQNCAAVKYQRAAIQERVWQSSVQPFLADESTARFPVKLAQVRTVTLPEKETMEFLETKCISVDLRRLQGFFPKSMHETRRPATAASARHLQDALALIADGPSWALLKRGGENFFVQACLSVLTIHPALDARRKLACTDPGAAEAVSMDADVEFQAGFKVVNCNKIRETDLAAAQEASKSVLDAMKSLPPPSNVADSSPAMTQWTKRMASLYHSLQQLGRLAVQADFKPDFMLGLDLPGLFVGTKRSQVQVLTMIGEYKSVQEDACFVDLCTKARLEAIATLRVQRLLYGDQIPLVVFVVVHTVDSFSLDVAYAEDGDGVAAPVNVSFVRVILLRGVADNMLKFYPVACSLLTAVELSVQQASVLYNGDSLRSAEEVTQILKELPEAVNKEAMQKAPTTADAATAATADATAATVATPASPTIPTQLLSIGIRTISFVKKTHLSNVWRVVLTDGQDVVLKETDHASAWNEFVMGNLLAANTDEVTLYPAGLHRSNVVMPFYEGVSWPPSVESVKPAVVGLLKFVARMHKCTIVHRDIKPSNTIIASDGDVRLIDFGAAALRFGDGLEQVGTPLFVAPEQFASTHSDMYSVGRTWLAWLYILCIGPLTEHCDLLQALALPVISETDRCLLLGLLNLRWDLRLSAEAALAHPAMSAFSLTSLAEANASVSPKAFS